MILDAALAIGALVLVGFPAGFFMWLFEPGLRKGSRVPAPLLLFALGFAAAIPLVYGILWGAQHTVGRKAIPPSLFSLVVAVAMYHGSLDWPAVSKRVRMSCWAALGAASCALAAGLLSVLAIVFWDAFGAD